MGAVEERALDFRKFGVFGGIQLGAVSGLKLRYVGKQFVLCWRVQHRVGASGEEDSCAPKVFFLMPGGPQPSSWPWCGASPALQGEVCEGPTLAPWGERGPPRAVYTLRVTSPRAGLGRGAAPACPMPEPGLRASGPREKPPCPSPADAAARNKQGGRKVRSLRACFIRDGAERQEGSVRVYMWILVFCFGLRVVGQEAARQRNAAKQSSAMRSRRSISRLMQSLRQERARQGSQPFRSCGQTMLALGPPHPSREPPTPVGGAGASLVTRLPDAPSGH